MENKGQNAWNKYKQKNYSITGDTQTATSKGAAAWYQYKEKNGLKQDTSSVQSWLESSQNYLNDAQKYLGSYRVKDDNDQEYQQLMQRNSALLAEAYDWRNQLADNEEMVASVNDVISALSNSRGSFQQYFDYYSQWETEEDYNTAVRYDGYRKKYSGQKYEDIQKALSELEEGSEELWWLAQMQHDLYQEDKAYTSKAASGLKSYEAQKIAERNEEEEKGWFEKAIASFAKTGDTTLPAAGMTNAISAYREDTSYREPSDLWTDGEKQQFGYLYAEDPKKAYQYAEKVNRYYTDKAEHDAQVAAGNNASKDFWSGAANTAGAIVTAPLGVGLADWLDNIAEYSARGTITNDGYLSPNEYFNAATSGIANTLNEKYGTIDEDVWMFGGKGVGDLYSLGVSGAQSAASSLAFGGPAKIAGSAMGLTGKELLKYAAKEATVPTLVQYFGMGAASGIDDKMSSGYTDEDFEYGSGYYALKQGATPEQAMAYGTIMGAMEGIAEALSVDNLIKVGSASTFKNWLLSSLNQGLGELQEEGITSVVDAFVDHWIMADKSKFSEYVQKFTDAGAENPKLKALIYMAGDVAFDAMGGFATGFGNAATSSAVNTGFDARRGNTQNIEAIKKYGEHTDALIQEGLESDKNSESYKLAQKYQQQVQGVEAKDGKKGKEGKALTGYQIRNLLAANQEQIAPKDLKKIQAAAETRLTALGQTEDVAKVAELATKYATGQKMSKADKSFLASSKYGSRVANELLPQNIASGDYSTDWAEEIGTKQVNRVAYNKKAIVQQIIDAMANAEDPAQYKALTERVGEEGRFGVSESEQATIRATGEAFDIDSAEVVTIGDSQVTFKTADGTEVYAGDIDFADDNQSFLVSAVSDIENITPAAANAIIHDIVDTAKPIGAQLNGIDEAYTYGYHGYSVEDLKAGQYAPNLSNEQMMSAYQLGQSTRKISNASKAEGIKKMRTAAQALAEKAAAEGKEAPKSNKFTITYNHGGGKVESIHNANLKGLRDQSRAGIEMAKVLHNLGIGGNYEFFNSYLSKTLKDDEGNALRVFLNDEGVEEVAYSGLYRKKDGTIRIDLNAYSGRGLTLDALSHELGHFIQQWSGEKYEALAEFLVKTYEGTDMTMHERVLREQARLKRIRKADVSYNEAYDEVVANAMSKMLADGKLVEKLTELRATDKQLAQKLWEGFKKILSKFFNLYEKQPALFHDAADLMEMKDTFEQLRTKFAEALIDASDNFQASLIAKEAGLDVMPVEDGTQYSYSSLAEAAGFTAVENEDGTRSFVRDGQAVSEVTIADIENSPIGAFINFSVEMKDISEADAKRQKEMFAKICTMACKTNDFAMTMQFVGSAVFTGMKANADKQYGTTYDFPSICTKTQAVIDAMSAKMMSLGRGLTTDEIVKLYDDVFASGNPVPCPECYVFSRWIGIGGLLDNIKKYQDYYGDMDVEDVAAEYRKMRAEVAKFAEEQGISFGKAKGALTAKLTKEFNKLTEKIEKAENQGEKVKHADRIRLAELEPMMNTVKGMTWLENVYFADSSLKKVNPKFRVPNDVLFDLNNGEAFATEYKDAWAFRTTQGAGYGKAITPYAEARLGEGVLVTNNTTNAIKGRAQGTLNNYFLNQKGQLDKQAKEALKKARVKQKIQAFIGGQRFQSTSDARYENASDYLLAALEMQAMGGMVQCYTKVDGAVPAFAAWGFSINQSLMPLNGGLDADGNVKDTAVGGMKPSVAFDNRDKHETAGTITIGVNDNHIREMFKQWVRDFIIPYHASGGKATVVAEFRRIQEGKEAKGEAVRSTDYSRTQSDKILSDEVLRWQGKTDAQIQRIHEIRAARIAILTGGKPNMSVVRSNRFLSALYDKLAKGGEWEGVKLAKSKVESQIFPNEFWDQTVSYDQSEKITRDYLEYCNDLGFLHRFSGTVPSNGRLVAVNGYDQNGNRVQLTDLAYKYDENGNKTNEVEPFFWKVLTDRRMYDNSGNYLPQKVVTLNDTTAETVTGFAKHNQGRQYDKAKAEALAQKILKGEQYSSQETDADRITLGMTDAERTAILSKKSVIAGVYEGQAEGAIKRNKADLDSGKIGLVKSALVRIGDEFGIFTDYDIADVDVKIQLSKGNIKESVSKDISPVQIAKLLPVLKTAVENAIGIESHANRYFYDDSTVFFENLLGGYVDGEYFVPVRFGLKHTADGKATLYVIVDQQPVESKKIKAEVVKTPGTQNVSPAISRSAFKVSVANLARFVNGKDLLRYLPDDMLSAEQKKTKWEAIAETVKKTDAKNDAKYTEFIASGNLRAVQNMVNQAAKVAGYTIKAWHGSRHIFDKFSKESLGSNTKTKASYSWFFAGDKDTANSYYPYGVMKELARQSPNIWKESDAEKMRNKGKLYSLYLKMENPLIVDVAGYDYAAHAKTADAFMEYVEQAEQNGNDGIILYHVRDNQLRPSAEESTVYMFKEPSQAKYADPITYDEQDNVVPISERFNEKKDELRYSSQETDVDNAPVFYSKMGKVIEGMKQEKFGASSVISMLRGRGVKAEEIRWSGIQAFLEGKKSVTKAELLEFIKGSMLHIEEQENTGGSQVSIEPAYVTMDGESNDINVMVGGEVVDFMEWDEYNHEYISDALGYAFSDEDEVLEYYTSKYDGGGTRWGDYKLDGGENYRELLFRLPGADYYNRAMQNHWGDHAVGVLAHARMQDFDVDGKKMLFIEEIQSDWHNAGHKHGYNNELDYAEVATLKDQAEIARSEVSDAYVEYKKVEGEFHKLLQDFGRATDDNEKWQKLVKDQMEKVDKASLAHDHARTKYVELQNKLQKLGDKAPDAPFKDNYHEFVLKRLIRMAAEEGYDSLGWTTADIQTDRWSDQFAEGYRIEYDQDIPKFLKKYGKQWGATVGKTQLPGLNSKETYYDVNREETFDSFAVWQDTVRDTIKAQGGNVRDVLFWMDGKDWIAYDKNTGNETDRARVSKTSDKVWSMDITPAMKKSVLEEGQEMYSGHETDNITNRDLLANAFEGISRNSVEYTMIQDYKSHIAELNELETKLGQLNAEIRKIRFGTEGARDTQKLRQLEDEAKKTAKEINRYDKRLLNMEASEPLRRVIDRERKKAAQKTREHAKEIQENKKVRAEQAELRHKIRKAVRDLDKVLNHGNKKLNVKEDMQNVVTKALKAADILFTDNYGNYDMLRNGIGADMSDSEEALVKTCAKMLKDLDAMPTDGYDNWQARQEAEKQLRTKMAKLKDVFARERKRLNNTTVSSVLGELADAYASLEKSEQSYVQGAYTEAVHNFLKSLQSEVGGTIVKDMTKDQLESVYAAYKMVLTTVRKANQMFNEDLKQTREQLGNAVIQEVIKAGGTHGLWTKGEIAKNQADWNNLKPIWVANRIGSDTFGKLMNGLFKGQYNFAVDVEEAKQFKQSMDQKYKPRDWDTEKLYEFESSTESKFSLNLQQIMSIYAFSKREQAYSHLLNGGFVFESNSTVVVDKKGIKRTYLRDGATSYKLNVETLGEIINTLTAEQKAYVDEMQAYLSDVMGAKGNEVSMKLYGIRMFKEKFYFPLRSSGAYMERAKEAELKKEQGQINLVNSGFTHSVKPEAKNPIVLSGFLDVWAEHCNEMSMYHSMVLPMEDFRKVYNYSTIHAENAESASVYQTIQDAYGKAATNYIDQLYRELNAGATVDPRETPFKAWVSKFKKAAVMLSASVVVQQFSSVGRAFALIDPDHFAGAKVNSGTGLSAADEMKKYAPVAIIKEMGGFDTGTKGSAKSYIMAEQYNEGERLKGFVKDEQYRSEIMGYLPAKADEVTWVSIWEAVKREIRAKHPKMDVKSEQFLALAGERFSEIIEKTQVYDSVLARSANMRSKGIFMSMATAFMAEPTTTINLLEDALRGRSTKKIARTFGAVAVSIVLNNALASIVYAMRDDDEDETFIEKYFQSFTSGMIDDFNPMSYYPFLKDVYSLFQGYDVERADMSVIADLRDAVKKLIPILGKDTSEMDDAELAAYQKQLYSGLMSFLDAGCSALGVPVKNVRRDANAIINTFKTVRADLNERDTTWRSFWDKVGAAAKDTVPVFAWTSDRTKQDKLYDAIMAGDAEYVSRLKSGYKTDSSYQSAVRKALRENDPRIHEAAVAWNNNDLDEYMRIAREIIAEKRFVQDDVVTAIRSEASSIAPDPDAAGTSKAKGLFTADKFASAIAQGDNETARAIRADVIQTAQQNGKTKAEAERSFQSTAKGDLKEAYIAGTIAEATAISALVNYCGENREKAEEHVDEWAFQKKYGFSYDERKKAYISGKISASEMKTVLINMGGLTEENAELQVQAYDWNAEGYEDATVAAVRNYIEYCAEYNVPKDVYMKIRKFSNNTENDVDKETGNTINYSAMKRVMAEIHKQDLTAEQKTAIAKSLGWSSKNIKKYKLW